MPDTVASLFTGGRGYDIGAEAAGLRTIWGVEANAKIAAVAERNISAPCLVARVEEVDYSALEVPYLLHASPECTRASQANSAGGESELDLAMAGGVVSALRTLRPRVFTLENVYPYRCFQSFQNILAALDELGYAHAYWHLNSADFGVPQTRKRLVLIASRDFQPVRPPATHRKGGDMVHLPWNGWYSAIADIIHTFPDTEPAPWQEKNLPREIRDSMLLSPAMARGGVVTRSKEEPAVTICAADINQLPVRAYIVANNNSQDQHGNSYGTTVRPADEPMLSVTGMSPGWWKAYLVNGENAYQEWGKGYREADEPATTLPARSTYPKAFLVQGQNSNPARAGDGLSPAVLGSHAPKAYVGVWKKLTLQALGRFQTMPDDYQGLTSEINGNAVPCLLAQCIVESVREQARRRRAA